MLESELKKLTAAVEALTQQLQQVGITPDAVDEVVTLDGVAPPQEEVGVDFAELKDCTMMVSRTKGKAVVVDKLAAYGVKKITDIPEGDQAEYLAWAKEQLV